MRRWKSCSRQRNRTTTVALSARDRWSGAQRERDEGESPIGAAAGRRRRGPDHEQVLVVVGAAEAVADARRGIGAHPAAAARVIQVIPFAGVDDASVAGLGER